MKIDTTLGALVLADPALSRLAEIKLPAKPGYHLAKLITLVRAEVAVFTAERLKLMKALGRERPATPEEAATMGPTVVQVPPERFPEFLKACDDLAAVDVTLPWTPFNLSALNDDAVLSAGDLVALGPLVTVDDDGGAPPAPAVQS